MRFYEAASALALASLPGAAFAQHQHGPEMDMSEPQPEQHQHEPGMEMPAPQPEQQPADQVDHSQMDHSQMDHSQMGHAIAADEHAGHVTTGALGPYPMTREASGTAWQPDASEHMGLMSPSGDWMLMAHGVLNLVYDHQSGPRGDDKVFPSGMVMGMARRPLGNGTLQFKAMVSPDPLMGKRGYPLLLASGETADGITPLIDRQHPHEFFMELSASVSQNIGPRGSVFLYGGLPGEPAFGPPAFMHREAIMDSPEAPITHHWLDSTHITFGVLTAGVVLDRVKVEVSRFNGREPDQHRWNIETGPLDSTAVRASWNPTRTLSLQGSWGYFKEPEQLEPGNQKRWSLGPLRGHDRDVDLDHVLPDVPARLLPRSRDVQHEPPGRLAGDGLRHDRGHAGLHVVDVRGHGHEGRRARRRRGARRDPAGREPRPGADRRRELHEVDDPPPFDRHQQRAQGQHQRSTRPESGGRDHRGAGGGDRRDEAAARRHRAQRRAGARHPVGMAPSSSGPGRRPLTAKTRVRVP
jgi:hypothetical protein